MRFGIMLGGLSVLVTIGVAVIAIGQRKMMSSLAHQVVVLNGQAEKLDAVLKDREFLRAVLQKHMNQHKKTADDLDAEMAKIIPDNEAKRDETDTCQAELATMYEELESIQKEQTDTQAEFDSESETWRGEINALQQQLQWRSEVCNYVRQDPAAQKLCGYA